MTYEFKQLDMNGALVYYFPYFFTDSKLWYHLVDDTVNWQSFDVIVYGKKYKQPRDSFYMADNTKPYKYSGFDRRPEKWCVSIEEMKKEVDKAVRYFQPDHPLLNACLGNRYNDGKQYISYHSDNEIDLHPGSFIASVSLGAERDFIFSHVVTKKKVKVSLASGSLLLMGGDCQTNWKHSLPKRLRVKDPRINLTFRSIVDREGY
jgi:alkylated DNA repair dioxygenase AlkB